MSLIFYERKMFTFHFISGSATHTGVQITILCSTIIVLVIVTVEYVATFSLSWYNYVSWQPYSKGFENISRQEQIGFASKLKIISLHLEAGLLMVKTGVLPIHPPPPPSTSNIVFNSSSLYKRNWHKGRTGHKSSFPRHHVIRLSDEIVICHFSLHLPLYQ